MRTDGVLPPDENAHPGDVPDDRTSSGVAVRGVLIVLLTVATGATDAIGFIRLGGVFTSVMTANMVLLGISGVRKDGSLALHSGTALIGFVVGSWLGALVAGPRTQQQGIWPRRISAALAVELGAFVFFGIWWEASAGHPSGNATYVLIAVNALALGIQSGAVLRFGITGMSTTYLTGTLTQIMSGLALRKRHIPTRSLAVMLALVTGAALGALLVIEAPRAAPAIPLGLLVVVLLVATTFFRGSSSGASDPLTNRVQGR
ncbi:MAG TPA: YoaK family protein [Acidimicrobiales bacterium]|nr:YoaK family protein [Acidimicrobiales bacterium]